MLLKREQIGYTTARAARIGFIFKNNKARATTNSTFSLCYLKSIGIGLENSLGIVNQLAVSYRYKVITEREYIHDIISEV